MPKMVTLEISPSFKADKDKESQDALAAAKKVGPKKVSYQSALESVRLSKGMYQIRPDAQEPKAAVQAKPLEDMDRRDLLIMATSLGMKTDKQMRVSDIITFINTRLNDVEMIEGDDEFDAD